MSDTGDPRSADEQRILRERADQLGRPPPDVETGPQFEVLRFTLAQEHYAVEITSIEEVIPFTYVTRIPCTPPYVLGAMSRRGRVLAVVDLKKFFGLAERGLVDLNRVVVLSDGHMEYGVLADAVLGVERVPESALHPAPATLGGLGGDAVRGITPDGLVVLDGPALLSDARLVVHEDVAG